MSDATTHGIRVQVRSEYVHEQSDPASNAYFFAYHVRVSNVGDRAAKLISRHWVITNSNGEVREVRGPGVVGEEPHLAPGQTFEYSSFCPLETPIGTMHGSYQMVTDAGEHFEARIAPFTLAHEETILH